MYGTLRNLFIFVFFSIEHVVPKTFASTSRHVVVKASKMRNGISTVYKPMFTKFG